MSNKKMPGPDFWGSIATGLKAKQNYLRPMEQMFAEYGDYVGFSGLSGNFGGVDVTMVFHPDGVEHVLRKNHKNYVKPATFRELHPLLGKGLLTSEGDEWKKHRQMIAPEFQHKKVESFLPVMQKHLGLMIESWRQKTTAFDVAPEISKLTYSIAGECFFGADLGETSGTVYHGLDFTSALAVRRMSLPLNIPLSVPLPSHLRVRRAIREMDKVVYRIIDDRTKNPTAAQDVLSRLLRVSAEPGAEPLSRTQIRDEVMTLLLAGHETSANALSWTLFLLGKHPEIQRQLRDEVMAAISGEIPALSELRGLKLTKMVLEESMRLYPPVASLGRQSLGEDEIGGYSIRPRTIVNMAPWITHRHPEFWTNPDDFIPERFAHPEKIHPCAYFPFAAGPRECVGKNMAMVEAIVLLAGMIRNFNFTLTHENVVARPLITIRPEPGVFMKLTPAQALSTRLPTPDQNLN